MKEYVDLVNKDDKVIGRATREECNSDKNKIHRSSSVFIFNSKGEMFLQKRSKTKDRNPGKYCSSCCGHVDSGETYIQAAVREIKEELNLEIEESQLKSILKVLIPEPDITGFHQLYALTYDGDIEFNKDEISSMDLMPMEKIRSKIDKAPELFAPAFIRLFSYYSETLKN